MGRRLWHIAALLGYLLGTAAWEPPTHPRPAPLDWTALALAIDDLIGTFG